MHYRPLPTSTSDAILREMFTDFGTIVEGVKRASHAFITGVYSRSPTRKCTKYPTIPNPLHSAGSDSNRSLQLILLFRLGKMEGEVSFPPLIGNGRRSNRFSFGRSHGPFFIVDKLPDV
jgi:hypothetical protein